VEEGIEEGKKHTSAIISAMMVVAAEGRIPLLWSCVCFYIHDITEHGQVSSSSLVPPVGAGGCWFLKMAVGGLNISFL